MRGRSTAAIRRRRAGLAITLIATTVGMAAALPGIRAERAPSGTRDSFTVGTGARAALVLRARPPRRRPAVVFLHGWGLTGPRAYDAWLRDLARRGSTVIVPRYQTSTRTATERVPDAAIAGVRAALRRVRPRPREVVVVGHSAGGVLAVDYAVRAASLGLPPARAVMVVFPGGALRDRPPLRAADPALIPAAVQRLLVMASPTDDVVGTGPAQAIYDAAVRIPAERRRIVSVIDPVSGDHFAPARDASATRRTFWSPLDRILSGSTGPAM